MFASVDNVGEIFDRSKKDLNLKTFDFNNLVNGIETTVAGKEHQRDNKLKCKSLCNPLVEYEREREMILNKQKEIRGKIDYLAARNINERLIQHLKKEVGIS
jgi:hypothetical protein